MSVPPARAPLTAQIDLKDTPVLVVGCGPVGQRKIKRLARAHASITLVSPYSTELAAWLSQSGIPEITWRAREFALEDLQGARLVFICTNHEDTNNLIEAHARARGIWCNRADKASAGNLSLMASISRGDLIMASASSRSAPALSRALRVRWSQEFGASWAHLAAWAKHLRPRVPSRTLKAWLNTDILRTLRENRWDDALQSATEAFPSLPASDLLPQSIQEMMEPAAQRQRIVLSAFGPFPGCPVNPTPGIAREVQRVLQQTHARLQVEVVELPTLYDEAWKKFEAHLNPWLNDAESPLAGVFSLGVAGRSTQVRLERIGVNHRRGGERDAGGRLVPEGGESLVPLGADGLFARLAVDRLAGALREEGHPVEVSNSAGTYICNEVLYKLLSWSHEREFEGAAGFVHVPPTPEVLSMDEVRGSLVSLITRVLRGSR